MEGHNKTPSSYAIGLEKKTNSTFMRIKGDLNFKIMRLKKECKVRSVAVQSNLGFGAISVEGKI